VEAANAWLTWSESSIVVGQDAGGSPGGRAARYSGGEARSVTRRLPLEDELIPYAPGFPPGRRWLVLAPHADDETLGPGATLALAARRGIEVGLVIVTDGAAQGDPAEREAESAAAARALGVPAPTFWRFADRGLTPAHPGLLASIRDVLRANTPDAVLVTSPVELHPDHRGLALALRRVLRRQAFGPGRRAPRWVVTYEVATPQHADVLVSADAGWDAKRRASACYRSQVAVRRYVDVMEALGDLRALTLDGVTKAEAFGVFSARRVAWGSARAWAARCAGLGSAGARRP